MAHGKMLLNVQTQLNLIFKISMTSSNYLGEPEGAPYIHDVCKLGWSVCLHVLYRGKLWWVQNLAINYRNTFGGINFSEFEHL